MNIWHSLDGMVRIEVLTADAAAMLLRLQNCGISLENVYRFDDITIRFTVSRRYLKRVTSQLEYRGEKWKIIEREGIYWKWLSMIRRPVLVCGLGIMILMTIYLPTRIFFLQVEGNRKIPDNQIMDIVGDCGVKFGADRRLLRSEVVKNKLLQSIPQLEWVGINTAGCVVTISVRERQNYGDLEKNPPAVSSIVARRDGVIQEITVAGGSAVCKQGQVVKAGQVLISGYTDCGLSIRAERAKGEVYATTNHRLSVILLREATERGEKRRERKRYSLLIGKKRINFYKDSGNLYATCAKICEEKCMTLPGGFQLPLTIVSETYFDYEQIAPTSPNPEDQTVSEFVQRYLLNQMIAGKILNCRESVTHEEAYTCLEGIYGCLEMIGLERSEEIITK